MSSGAAFTAKNIERVGDHVTEIGEPALGHQVRPRPVPGGQGPSNDLLGLGDVEPALGLDPAPQSDIGQGDIVGEAGILRVGDLAIDLIARSANRRGRKIPLLPREFQLLEYLVRNEGRVVSRAMLLQHVWDLHFDPSTNIIDVYVGRVRRKVDDQQAYPLIHTIRGIGYCLRAPG